MDVKSINYSSVFLFATDTPFSCVSWQIRSFEFFELLITKLQNCVRRLCHKTKKIIAETKSLSINQFAPSVAYLSKQSFAYFSKQQMYIQNCFEGSIGIYVSPHFWF